ncbi:MAG: tetratricopeptide repeat protein [archaeon]|nr:tetratricopeptide repeat protein [archaeon]
MARPLAFIGGIITIIGFFSTLILSSFGIYFIIITPESTGEQYILWYNVLGQLQPLDLDITEIILDSSYQDIPLMLWGVLILIGAFMCFHHKKRWCYIGSRLITMSISVFLFNIFLINPFELSSKIERINVLFGTMQDDNIVYTWGFGAGFFLILTGGIFGWIGATLPEYSKTLSRNKKKIKNNDRDVNAWIDLGNKYHALSDLKQAIFCIRKAVELYPHEKTSWLNLGNLYIEKKKFFSAKECFKNALDIDPEYSEASIRINFLKQAQNRENYVKKIENAIEKTKKRVRRFGNSSTEEKFTKELQSIN